MAKQTLDDVSSIISNGVKYYDIDDIEDDLLQEIKTNGQTLKYYIKERTYIFYVYDDTDNKLKQFPLVSTGNIQVVWNVYYEADITSTKLQNSSGEYILIPVQDKKYRILCSSYGFEPVKNATKSQLQQYLADYEKKVKEIKAQSSKDTSTQNTTTNSSTNNEGAQKPTNTNTSTNIVNSSTSTETEVSNTEVHVRYVGIFDDSNYVNEEVYQVRIKDDRYVQDEPVDTNAIIQDLEAVDSVTTLMGVSVEDVENSSDIIIDPSKPNTVDAVVGLYKSVNDFGEYLLKGEECPICHRRSPALHPNGYCSLECAGKALLEKLDEFVTGEQRTSTPDIIRKIKNVLNFFNLVLNVVVQLPKAAANLAKLPPDFKEYATAKLNQTFLTLKKTINRLLIKKNELLIQLLTEINNGLIDQDLQQSFEAINTLISLVKQLKEQLDVAIYVATKALTKLNSNTYIGPHEYGFFWTLKSNSVYCPYYKTDTNVYPPEQIGKAFWGEGALNIAFDMSKSQINLTPGIKSVLQNVDYKKIHDIIHEIFPPLKETDYNMDPELFKSRLAFSIENAPAIQGLIKKMENMIVIGGDFIPTYDKLNLNNIWFIIAILTCWGPWTKSIYGDYIYHAYK